MKDISIEIEAICDQQKKKKILTNFIYNYKNLLDIQKSKNTLNACHIY